MLKILFIILSSFFITLAISCTDCTKQSRTIPDHIQSNTESKTIEEYLEVGFKSYQSFDELNVAGLGIPTHNPFVMVRLTDTLVEVVRSNELETVYQYKRMPWGWYNRILCNYDIQGSQYDCRFDRYIYGGRIIEIERLYYPEGREFCSYCFLKDSTTCISSSLKGFSNWDENTVPDESIVNQEACVKYEMKKGLKKSYYISESSDETICYSYARNDTDLFSRSPGIALKSIDSDIYNFHNGAFTNVEVMPIVDEDKIGEYILSHSRPLIKEYVEHDKMIVWLKISESGRIEDVVLLRPRDEIMARQLCHTVPIHCIPGTIAEKPVVVWYTIKIEPKNRE